MSSRLNRTTFSGIPFPVDLCLGLDIEKFVTDSEVAMFVL